MLVFWPYMHAFTLHTFICFLQLHVEAGRLVQRALFCPQTTLVTTPRDTPVCMRSQYQESSVRNTLSTWPHLNISEGLLIADPVQLLSRTYVCRCERTLLVKKFYIFISEYWCFCNWIGTLATHGMCICVCFCNNARNPLVLMGF